MLRYVHLQIFACFGYTGWIVDDSSNNESIKTQVFLHLKSDLLC